jgi:Carboxypeptidase regulatory-like domain
MSVCVKRVVILVCLLLLIPVMSRAQGTAARQGKLLITVLDPSNAVVQEATVTVVGLEPSTQAATLSPVKTGDKGVAVIENLAPGRYSVRAEFPGFDIGLLRDVRVRAGDNKQVVVLPLAKLEDSVTVGRDMKEVAADRRTTEFGVALRSDQIEALSDDPAELARQLNELAGPDAVVRVDSFEGQQLPPKAQIKSIHVVRDQFAAEAAQPGTTFVDVVTQPGIGPVRGTVNFSIRDGSMTGRSQFTDRKGPEQFKDAGGNIGGSLIQGKSSFSFNGSVQDQFTSPILHVALPGGTVAETLNIRQPNRFTNSNGLVDYAVTKDQTLRFSFNSFDGTRKNIGVGNYDLPERAYTQENSGRTIRIQEAGPLGRRSFINTRLSYSWQRFGSFSATNAPTIVVQDAFTSGSAQQTSDVHFNVMTLASDFDYVRGINSWRAGMQIDGQWFRSTNSSNALGTYTFSSLDAFDAGTPVLYTQSLGNPEVQYMNLQAAFYVQDDLRIRKGLTLSPGVRYNIQKRVDDYGAIEPRFGVTWAPGAAGKTTLRGSAGIFHNFLPAFAIEQTLRMDGEKQRELVVTNPSYPNPNIDTGFLPPTNKYLIGDFKLGRNVRYSAGVDQVVTPRIKLNVLYNYIHLQQQARGRNLNAPVDGVRPDPRYANVIESVTDTEIRRHEVFVNSTITLAPLSPALNQKRFNWKRMSMNAGYSLIHARNNSNGFFAVPPTGNVEDDWGPGPADSPYRVQLLMTNTMIRNVTANFNWLANSGFPYTLTTGFDDNHDGLINDRPAGVGLRTLRMAGQSAINARFQYTFTLGGSPTQPGAPGRYRLNTFVNIQNLTNHQNLGGYSGVMTSPFFRRPTLAINPRSVNMGVSVNF